MKFALSVLAVIIVFMTIGYCVCLSAGLSTGPEMGWLMGAAAWAGIFLGPIFVSLCRDS